MVRANASLALSMPALEKVRRNARPGTQRANIGCLTREPVDTDGAARDPTVTDRDNERPIMKSSLRVRSCSTEDLRKIAIPIIARQCVRAILGYFDISCERGAAQKDGCNNNNDAFHGAMSLALTRIR
jgi:hypothetical protein